MKIIVGGILQKMLKYWTIRQRNDRPSNPATQRILLEIDWFQTEIVVSLDFYGLGHLYSASVKLGLNRTGHMSVKC
jgi:hypothetical protein